MKKIYYAFFRKAFTYFCLFLLITVGITHAEEKDTVVKIYVVYNEYNYHEPWQMKGLQSRHGSGVIIKGNRILTNAHVVCNNTFLQVRKSGQAKRYTAVVDIIDHKSDLALLRIKDKTFFNEITPLEFGEFSRIKEEVFAYGFPEGGDKLSITRGVISRIEHKEYKHSGAYLLACQLDASINPGNSGGPVIKNGKIVGIAFQNAFGEQIENIGYMIPVPGIKRFLEDIVDGRLDGIPELGVSMQKLENSDMRNHYQMQQSDTGVLVNSIFPDSPALGILESEDVLLKVDHYNIENDGTIEFRKGERTYLGFALQQKQINEKISLLVLRKGKRININLTLSKPLHCCRLVPYRQYETEPRFYIIGGLVFEVLSLNYLYEYGGANNFYLNAPTELLNLFYNEEQRQDRKEVVLLVQVLADEVNVGYHEFINGIISKVNGKKINVMEDLVSAFETWNGDYHVIEDIKGFKIILNSHAVKEADNRILKKYKIFSDRSAGL
ncbi:S1C family serine protease [Desulfobacula toluolica]|uniref:Serine protease, related to trypsin n=1 Tax=Desulfobacula toluolica (strain DSM 7467 / Tol2) TaxID=651182 RepID=K0NI71_DESTT|nr:serine protease [Desulfobacula toluolica]CCK81051.1 serine protease, related to trypsin [Desulfobacula toluolica Tol2]